LALAFFLTFAAPLFAQDAVTRATPLSADIYSNVTVKRVLGLETLELENGEKVQLIGIDYPEIYMRLPQGQEAMSFLKSLVENKKVRLEFDVEKRDANGRLLAYVDVLVCSHCDVLPNIMYDYKFGEDAYIFVNSTMIKAGYAEPMTSGANIKYAALFQKLHQEAMEKKRGWWKEAEKQVLCTAEAKLCPDGSSVGRVPPDCKFAQCPQ